MNKVEISGNIGQDIEVVEFDNGKKVCNFSIAYHETYNDEKKTTWFNCKAWNKTAEEMKKFKKGSFIKVEGKLYEEEYTDKEGAKRKSTRILAFEVAPVKRKVVEEVVEA